MLRLGLSLLSSVGVLKNIVRDGLVMFNKFSADSITHPSEGSATFDGVSDYIQLDTPFNFTNHTIAAWVYVEDNSSNKMIFDNRDSSGDGIRLMSRSSEELRYSVNTISITTTPTYINEWVYVVATYDGANAKLFVDGSQMVSDITTQTVNVDTNATIGVQSFSSSNYFQGNLSNVAIWNRALSDDEINSVMWKDYDSLVSSELNGLQAWYSLDDISGTNVPDSSVNGNDGTAN